MNCARLLLVVGALFCSTASAYELNGLTVGISLDAARSKLPDLTCSGPEEAQTCTASENLPKKFQTYAKRNIIKWELRAQKGIVVRYLVTLEEPYEGLAPIVAKQLGEPFKGDGRATTYRWETPAQMVTLAQDFVGYPFVELWDREAYNRIQAGYSRVGGL